MLLCRVGLWPLGMCYAVGRALKGEVVIEGRDWDLELIDGRSMRPGEIWGACHWSRGGGDAVI